MKRQTSQANHNKRFSGSTFGSQWATGFPASAPAAPSAPASSCSPAPFPKLPQGSAASGAWHICHNQRLGIGINLNVCAHSHIHPPKLLSDICQSHTPTHTHIHNISLPSPFPPTNRKLTVICDSKWGSNY